MLSTDDRTDNSRMHTLLAKMMEDKHTFTYRKLVVPMSMRSIYWKYFGFPATEEDEILTKVKIVCTICKTQIAYNRNTSNLRMHLQNKHPDELQVGATSDSRAYLSHTLLNYKNSDHKFYFVFVNYLQLISFLPFVINLSCFMELICHLRNIF